MRTSMRATSEIVAGLFSMGKIIRPENIKTSTNFLALKPSGTRFALTNRFLTSEFKASPS